MFARYTTATGALIADKIEQEPAPAEGVTVIEMPPSAIDGLTVWSATARGYVDPPPPVSRLDAFIALMLANATANTPLTQAQIDALPRD